ncbi:MAG: cyclic nucleotide-binding domain-containing protein [Deltaproteobacteria bacterium]|nr:cyclic nucleotide-binding domain-containing protein [Deltaproteobacteria bacterium]
MGGMNQTVVLSGKIAFLDLAELIQLIGNAGSSGSLRIKSLYHPTPGTIYFEKGNPINAEQGSLVGLKALFTLFGWADGDFEFDTGPMNVAPLIKKNRMEIILEALRLLDDGKIAKLGPEAVQKPMAGLRKAIHELPIIKGPIVDYLHIAAEETYRAGEIIVEEGKYGNWLWVILEGIVDIIKQTPQGPMTILTISEGAFIGDIGTFMAREHVRSASVVARGTVQLGVLDSQRLSNVFAALSRLFRDLLISFDKRLKLTSHNVMLARLKQPIIADVQEGFSPVSKSDEELEQISIIRKGSIIVARPVDSVNVVMAELGPGDFIGRLSFLNTGQEPYSASVYATEDLELSPIDPSSIEAEYSRLPNAFKNIIESMSACISATTQTADAVTGIL